MNMLNVVLCFHGILDIVWMGHCLGMVNNLVSQLLFAMIMGPDISQFSMSTRPGGSPIVSHFFLMNHSSGVVDGGVCCVGSHGLASLLDADDRWIVLDFVSSCHSQTVEGLTKVRIQWCVRISLFFLSVGMINHSLNVGGTWTINGIERLWCTSQD